MAGKIMRMSTIKQLLSLHCNGYGIKYISRHLTMSRNTVRSYLNKFKTLQCSVDELLKLDDPVLEARFHSGSPAYSDIRHEELMSQIAYIMGELKKPGVTRQLLWEEYKVGRELHYCYSQFCYHLDQHAASRHPTMVLHHDPADKLMIDFSGKKMQYIDRQTGEEISCQLYIATLPYSGYVYVEACRSQDICDFIACTSHCLHALGGAPKALVTDNLKSAVTKVDKYEPEVNVTFEHLANHYGSVVFPTRAYKPRDKGAVENMVKIVYTQVKARLRNVPFFSITELNEGIKGQVFLLNQRRMQTKGYTRQEQFNAAEKPLLKPLPDLPFEIQYTKKYKVAQNNHICLSIDKHYYSVPHTYIGKEVKVIYTRTTVRIYHRGVLICAHVRNPAQGKYTTVEDHLCSAHRAYNQRSPEYYIQKASKISDSAHQLFELLFDQPGRYPEQLYKTCDGLIRLAKTYSNGDEFDNACKIGIDEGIYNYSFIKRLLDNKMTSTQPSTVTDLPLPKHTNIRGKEYYVQTTMF
jgi:transposase